LTTFDRKRRLAGGISVAAVAAAITFAHPALAQTTSTIRGEGATAGATITVTDQNTGRSVSTRVNADGTFVIPGLRPSTYRVVGAGQPQDVTLPVGQTVTIDSAPQVAAGAPGAIIVTGRRNRQEVRSAAVGTSVSQQQIENLPQNDRNFLNFAALAPGVTVSPDVGANNKRIQAGGVSADNVNVYIDGSSHKNRVGFNGVAGQSFSQGNPFPQSAVQEFRVETQNFKAEYEQAGSAIITAVTRTGGDKFRGGVFGDFMPKKWFGRPFFDRPGEANNSGFPCPDDATDTCYNEKPNYKRYQFGADLGGPIIPGLLHFFAAYEGTRQNNPQSFVVNPPANLEGFSQEEIASKFKQNLYFGKATLFASDADTLHASYFKRDEEDVRDYGGNRARSTGRNVGTATKNYQLEWNHRADTWLNEMTLSYFDSNTGTPRLTEGPEIRLVVPNNPATPFEGEEFFTGSNSFVQANRQKDKNFKNNFTYTGIDGHVIKAGVRYSRNKLIREEEAFALGQYSFLADDYDGFDSSIPFRAIIAQLPPLPITAKNTYVGLFAQDDWTVNDHLTINYGLRWDYESNNFNQNYVTPDNVAEALRNYQPWEAAGIDAEDYISTGDNRDPYMKAFAPRLGVSYDVNGDRDLIFFVGAGRYYDRNNFYTASLEQLFNEGRSDVTIQFCDIPGRACDPLRDAAGNLPTGFLEFEEAYRDPDAIREAIGGQGLKGNIWALNNDTPPPYTDQFNVGVRKRFGDWQTSATIAHNRGYNQFIYVRGNRMPDGSYTPAGPGFIRDNFPEEGRPEGYTGRLNIGSSEGKSRYTALYLQAEKPWTEESGWQTTVAVTISNAKSNQARAFGEAEMFNAGEQDAYGWNYISGLEKWRFVGSGMVRLPWDFRLSSTVILAAAPRFGYVSFAPELQPCGGCIPFNDSGILGAEADIGYKTVDVRLAKRFATPWGHELEANVQVFNLFDWVNRNYETWGAGNAGGGLEPPLKQNGTRGPARSFQAGLRYRF
jgi:outer membrane receptor protein involved in Fe transport